MKKLLNTILALLILASVKPVLSEEAWPACPADDESSDCISPPPKKHKLSFSETSFNTGLDYLRNHPAPLSVFVSKKDWHTLDDNKKIPELNLSREQHTNRLVKAQVQLIKWFQDDIQHGYSTPKITTSRLIKINKIITKNPDPMSKTKGQRNISFASQLTIEFLTDKVISEISQIVADLRRSAGFESIELQLFGVYRKLVNADGSDAGTDFYQLPAKTVKKMIQERAAFLEKYIHTEAGKKYSDIKTHRGGYITSNNGALMVLDAARIFYHVKKKNPEINFLKHQIYGLSVEENSQIFHLFDVPDRDGELTKSYPHPCRGCVRTWYSFMPPDNSYEQSFYRSIYVTTAKYYKDRKAILDKTVSTLNNNLKPHMTKSELKNVLAESWRQLVLIHPFRDGNGRTMRLLINALFMSYGLPPLTCDPDCLPYSHTFAYFKKDIDAAMTLTEKPLPDSVYPQWLYQPDEPALLEKIRGL